jgi:hypothetical protein
MSGLMFQYLDYMRELYLQIFSRNMVLTFSVIPKLEAHERAVRLSRLKR